jgi:hypothetical protein
MEETQGTAAVEPEAPPGATDAAVATVDAPPIAEAAALIDVTKFPDFDDPVATEAWIAASTEATNAQAAADEAGETVATTTDPTATAETGQTAAAPVSADAPKPSEPAPSEQPDPAIVAEYLKQQGYKVEAPPPPPTPFQELNERLDPLVGTPELYADVKAKALADLPPLPDETLTDNALYEAQKTAYQTAVAEKRQATEQLRSYDAAREVTGLARAWAEQRQNGILGSALSGLPAQYGLDAARAQRVTQPTAMTDAVAAVVEAVTERLTAEHSAKLAERETYWKGQVAKAGADKSAANLQQMGRAPQAGSVQGGRIATPGPAWGSTVLPSEEWIQQAASGRFDHVDLSDR